MTEKLDRLMVLENILEDAEIAFNAFEEDFGADYILENARLELSLGLDRCGELVREERARLADVWTVSFLATPHHNSYPAGHVDRGIERMNRANAEKALEQHRTYWDNRNEDPIWVPFIERLK